MSYVYVADFVAELEARRFSPATVEMRQHGATQFVRYLENTGVERLQDVDTALVLKYRCHLYDSGYKPNTVEIKMRAVAHFFEYLSEKMLVLDNPTARLTLYHRRHTIPQILTQEEVKRLLNMPDLSKPSGVRDRAILETLYATGCRRGELLGMRVDCLNLAERTVVFDGKFSKQRVVPLGLFAGAWVERYLIEARPQFALSTDCDALWLTFLGGPVSKPGIAGSLTRYGRLAGISQSVHPHLLRRSCATHMLAQGANPMLVAELLGHTSVKTLRYYLRVSARDLKDMHGAAHPGK